MLKYIKSNENQESQLLFTPAALLDILVSIEELKDYSINLTTNLDGSMYLQVGDSYYELNTEDKEAFIAIDSTNYEIIEDANEEAFQELIDSGEAQDSIESGLVVELMKTLLVGGAVRLGKKYLQS